MSQKYALPINRAAGVAATDFYKVFTSDMSTTASTVLALTLDTIAANSLVQNPSFFLKTAFSSTNSSSTTALVMSLGTSSSATLFLASTNVFTGAAAVAAQSTYKAIAVSTADTLVATFTSTTGLINTFSGEVDIYIAKPRLDTEANY